MRTIKKNSPVLQRFLLPSTEWHEGYRAFNQLFGRPLGWMFLFDKEKNHLVRLDRKDYCPLYSASKANQQTYESFLRKYCEMLAAQPENLEDLPCLYKDVFGRWIAVFGLKHLGKLKGLLILSALKESPQKVKAYFHPFNHFLKSEVELAYKNFELNNFYETVHPRALALSTMHSVHRVISSSVRLKDLLPRIGRLSAQVLKAKGCSIMLVGPGQEYLFPVFSFGDSQRFVHKHRLKIGRGLEGRVAATGEFHLRRRSIAVPFIEDDIVGVITLWDRIDNQPFTKTDLEILKTLSEQAVTAIKNAQLYEETEQLTLGSIKTINELLELNAGKDRVYLSFLADLVMEVGKELELSGREMIHIQRAIMLRDTGALALPDKLWNKKGKLTKKEFAQIKRIPMRGADLLSPISSLKPVLPIILHHRERFDGKGYPQGLKGEEIPIGARIVAIADSFVAMISERSYREQMTVEEALREIQAHSGTQFDPRVVECFLKVMHRKEMLEKLKNTRRQVQMTKAMRKNGAVA